LRRPFTESLRIRDEVLEAEKRIRTCIRETPLEFSRYLSRVGESNVFLKLENLQTTGSFKLRGAANKLLSLRPEEKRRGLVTASSGNHGAAFAYLLDKLRLQGTIFLPHHTSAAKVDSLRLYGAQLEFHGDDCLLTEAFAKKNSEETGRTFVSPYNDVKIIGGHGTIGAELQRQAERIDAVFIPVGGGGLASGIAGYLKSVAGEIEIIGCQPQNSPVMYESVKAGKIVQMESLPTLSDGTAGGIEEGSVTFDICRECLDEFVLVSEDEIKEALVLFLAKHHMLIEGSAALAIASYLKLKERFKNRTVVLIISGAKLSLEKLKEILL
jgi:threonine dehydratase